MTFLYSETGNFIPFLFLVTSIDFIKMKKKESSFDSSSTTADNNSHKMEI